MIRPVINSLFVAILCSTLSIANATEVECPGRDCSGVKPMKSKKEEKRAEKTEEKKAVKDEGVKIKTPKKQETQKKEVQKSTYR